MRAPAAVGLGSALGAAFYMVLIDTIDLPELYAGIGAVLLAGAAYEAARRQGVAEARVSLRWVSRSWRVIASIPGQIAWVSWQAPNTIVIGIDGERDLLLVHQLHRSGGREQLDVLELG